jgi:arylsulfatase A-like enzyme
MFTSLYPSYHNVISIGDILSSKIPFLPQILQNNGYETFLYIPYKDLSLPIDDVFQKGATKIISEGRHDIKNPFSYLDKALDSFLSNIKNNKKTFSFLHTYYVHDPYTIEDREKMYTKDSFDNIPLSFNDIIDHPFTWEDYQKLLEEASLKKYTGFWKEVSHNFYNELKNAKSLEEAEKIFKSQGDGYFWHRYYVNGYMSMIDRNNESQVEYIKALYDQKIHEFDEWVGNKLVPFLENPLVKNNTMVIITSDHGEEFMEHNNLWHQTLYNPNIKTPLIIRIPNIANKKVISSVQSVDIVPTVLDVIGISSDGFSFQGQSLIDLIQKNIKTDRLLITNGFENKTKTIIKENWKLFLKKNFIGKYIPYELYDIKSDTNETNNILTSHMNIVNKIIKEEGKYEKTQTIY